METAVRIFDVRNVTRALDEQLAGTENPRHRAMLKNLRRHALLEVSGRWREILTPEMMVDHPVYRINENGKSFVLDGMEEVARFYDSLCSAGLMVFGPIEERVAVADWGIALESLFGNPLPGRVLVEQGEHIDDPDGWYQLTHTYASFWPYDDDCRLMGEHIYEDVSSRQITKMDDSDVVTPEEAARILAPYLENEPD